MSDCGCEIEIKNKSEAKVLIILLLINAAMFVVEISVGLFAQSTGLIADSMDMLADASVYAISLYAVGRSLTVKNKAAYISGIMQISLGLLVLLDITRRFIYGSEPESSLMMIFGLIALVANTLCLILIYKHRHGDVHMRASWIFSTNDVIANIGVIISGGLVAWLASPYPDLIIGLLISAIVIRGGLSIIKDSKKEIPVEEASN